MLATVILNWSESAGHTGTIHVPTANGFIVRYREWRGDELSILRDILGDEFDLVVAKNHEEFKRQAAQGDTEWPYVSVEREIKVDDKQIARLKGLLDDQSFELGTEAERLSDGSFGPYRPL